MNAQTIYFQNMVLFKKSLSSGEDFIIYFELNKGNDKYLSQIINSCLEVRHCKGVVFYLDSQKRHVPEKLLFLRKKIGQLLIDLYLYFVCRYTCTQNDLPEVFKNIIFPELYT